MKRDAKLKPKVLSSQITPKEALVKEVQFAVRCSETSKPVKHKTPTPSSSPSSSRSRSMAGLAPLGRSLARSLLQLNAFQRLGGGDKEK